MVVTPMLRFRQSYMPCKVFWKEEISLHDNQDGNKDGYAARPGDPANILESSNTRQRDHDNGGQEGPPHRTGRVVREGVDGN